MTKEAFARSYKTGVLMNVEQLRRSGGAKTQHRRNDVRESQLASARLEQNAIVSKALKLICRRACLRHASCGCSAFTTLTRLEFCFSIVWHVFDAVAVCYSGDKGVGREASIDQGPPASPAGVSVQRSIGSARPAIVQGAPPSS